MEGDGMVPERERQPATNNFDTKIKTLFAKNNDALGQVENFLGDHDRYGNDWWKRLYSWLDEKDFHDEKSLVAQITLESLDSIPLDAKLSRYIRLYWIDKINWLVGGELERKQVLNTLIDPSIPMPLRFQLGKYVAESSVTPYPLTPQVLIYILLTKQRFLTEL